MPYDSIGSDLALLDEKMQFGSNSRDFGSICCDEQAAHAQIPNWGYILTSCRAPVYIDAL
jgi:hypothetical protein